MFNTLMKSMFGSSNERYVKSLGKIVAQINALEPQLQALSDEELAAQTDKFRGQLADGKTLDDILPEAFATVREASVRVLGMRHFDVQMVGGIVLHRGEISEMRTGEGKTLVATLATYLNAIEGKGVHVVTVNDYLAARDAEWMGRLHRFLGLTVGVIVPNLAEPQRRDAYNSDITYSTNNELGFDYRRPQSLCAAFQQLSGQPEQGIDQNEQACRRRYGSRAVPLRQVKKRRQEDAAANADQAGQIAKRNGQQRHEPRQGCRFGICACPRRKHQRQRGQQQARTQYGKECGLADRRQTTQECCRRSDRCQDYRAAPGRYLRARKSHRAACDDHDVAGQRKKRKHTIVDRR